MDGAALSITYGRPSMRGRKIFGNLVPFDRVWCPGADECTRLSTNRDLQFAGLKLKAGDYSLWMLPTETAWTLTFNSDGRAFHTRRDPRLDVGKIALQKQTLPAPVEQLTFAIGPNSSAPAASSRCRGKRRECSRRSPSSDNTVTAKVLTPANGHGRS